MVAGDHGQPLAFATVPVRAESHSPPLRSRPEVFSRLADERRAERYATLRARVNLVRRSWVTRFGHLGRVLQVDLSRGGIEVESLDDESWRLYAGGAFLRTRLLVT